MLQLKPKVLYTKIKCLFLLVPIVILVIFFGLGWIFNRGAFPKPSPNNPPSNQPTQVTNQSSTATSLSPDSCDPSLWNHIPLPKTKLKILDQCKTVTGTIETIHRTYAFNHLNW